MLSIKRKAPPPPGPQELLAIDNVVDVQAVPADEAKGPSKPKGETKGGAKAFLSRLLKKKPVPGKRHAAGAQVQQSDARKGESRVEQGAAGPLEEKGAHTAAQTAHEAAEATIVAAEDTRPDEGPGGLAGLSRRWKVGASMFAKRSKSAQGRAAEVAGEAVSPVTPTRHSRPKGKRRLVLALEVGAGQVAYWTVSGASLERAELLEGDAVLSFTAADTLMPVEGLVAARSADDMAIAELGQEASVINASKSLRFVAATPRSRVYGSTQTWYSGALLLAELLRQQKASPKAPLVTGFHLVAEGQEIVILFVLQQDGLTAERPQVVVNPSDLEFAISQFASSRRLGTDAVATLFFSLDELSSGMPQALAYPAEDTIFGVRESHMWLGFCVAAGIAAAGAAGYAWTQKSALEAASQSRARLEQQAKAQEAQAATLARERFSSLVKAASVDVSRSLQRAQALWVPGVTVSLVATPAEDQFELRMPFQRPGPAGVRVKEPIALTTAELERLVDLAAPEQCSRTGLSVTGAMNEVQLSVACQNTVDLPSGYLPE